MVLRIWPGGRMGMTGCALGRRGHGRAGIGVAARIASVAWLSALIATVLAAPAANAAEGCTSEARRIEQASSYLPDCRGYELVTPAQKDSSEPEAVVDGLEEANLEGVRGAHAAVDGDRMAWDSEYALLGSPSPGLDYLSTRGVDGWSSENVIPPQSVENGVVCPNLVGMVAWSSDLSKGVLSDGFGQSNPTPTETFYGEGLKCGHDEPRLVPGEPEGFPNLFVRDSDGGSFQLVNVTPSGVAPPKPYNEHVQYFPASFLAGSTDLSHVVFEEELGLTPEAPSGDDLYEWTGGRVRLVTVLPDGTPALGTLAGATRNTSFELATSTFVTANLANVRHAVSASGSRIFFQFGGGLYVRENAEQEQSALGGKGKCLEPAKACTVQVDLSQAAGPGGGGEFMVASETGSKVFFFDDASAGLTANTVSGSGVNLYEYDLESGTLTDLTVGPEAGVLGVSGAGEDGSHVYFVAEGALASGASAGQPNLYVYHAGTLTFIATLDAASDSCDWSMNTGCLTARVSANGEFIGFPSIRRLTGYDNTDARSGEPDNELFLDAAATGTLSCASCSPTGALPTAPAIIRHPAEPDTNIEQMTHYPQRNVSDDGQLFFETSDELLPADTNGMRNVYEYEDGRLYLISSGTSVADSYFLDASVSGSDVFFATAQELLPRDQDAAYDIYDARVEGGFPEPAGSGPPCESGDGCRGTVLGAPIFSMPGSATFVGAGNLVPVPASKQRSRTGKCKKGYVKRKQRCVRKPRHRAKKSTKGRK